MPFLRLCLTILVLAAVLAPEDADARRRPVRRRAPVHRRVQVKATPRPAPTPEPNAYPLYLGDLYVLPAKAPLWSKPAAGAQVLAQLPKRTIVTNMGRVAVRVKRGAAYFYKVEAPNGKVGFLAAQQVGPQPPDW